MEKYEVTLNAEAVGTVAVTEEGLYLRFRCQCTVPKDQLYKLFVLFGTQRCDLGVLVPDGEIFHIDKKIPKKVFITNAFRFLVFPKSENTEMQLVPIEQDCPCPCLKYVHKAHLEIIDGSHCVAFKL